MAHRRLARLVPEQGLDGGPVQGLTKRTAGLWGLALVLWLASSDPRGAAGAPTHAPRVLTDASGAELVRIPRGTFTMGQGRDERRWAESHKPDWWDEATTRLWLGAAEPAHRVSISRPFYMGRTEVTVGQFRRFVEATGYKTTAETDGKGGMYYGDGKHQDPDLTWRHPRPGVSPPDDAPVTQVTWHDAVAYCDWMSKTEGVTYRLPTEAEWEWAARGRSKTRFYFGNDWSEMPSHAVVGGEGPQATGQKRPNPFGLYDVYGNVWEWVADYGSPDYYARSPNRDPKGPKTGEGRVRRGGNWAVDRVQMRSAYRKWSPPDYRGCTSGFASSGNCRPSGRAQRVRAKTGSRREADGKKTEI